MAERVPRIAGLHDLVQVVASHVEALGLDVGGDELAEVIGRHRAVAYEDHGASQIDALVRAIWDDISGGEPWPAGPRRGRPPIEDEPRSATHRIRCTPGALERWRVAADLRGEHLSDVTRSLLDEWAEGVLVAPKADS